MHHGRVAVDGLAMRRAHLIRIRHRLVVHLLFWLRSYWLLLLRACLCLCLCLRLCLHACVGYLHRRVVMRIYTIVLRIVGVVASQNVTSLLASVVVCLLPTSVPVRATDDLAGLLHLGAQLAHLALHALAQHFIVDVWIPIVFAEIDELVEFAVHGFESLHVVLIEGVVTVLVHEFRQDTLRAQGPYVLALYPFCREVFATSTTTLQVTQHALLPFGGSSS